MALASSESATYRSQLGSLACAGERDEFNLNGGRSVGATSNGHHAAQRDDRNGSGMNAASTNGALSNGTHSANGFHAEGIHKKGLSAAPKRVLEVAVVGYGNWGSKHVRVFSGMPDVRVTVVDSDPLRLAEA